ncbi:MAG TPA: hypothetical protein VFV28_04760 [Limnobacter sp.]|nr:hypothetical protein [Limnobacter sp.]
MTSKFDELEARKELLRMRAELERMELGGHIELMKQEFTWRNLLGNVGGWIGHSRSYGFGPMVGAGGQLWEESRKKHPVLSMVATSLFMRFRRPILRVLFKASLGATILAAGVYLLQRRSHQPDPTSRQARLDHNPRGSTGS